MMGEQTTPALCRATHRAPPQDQPRQQKKEFMSCMCRPCCCWCGRGSMARSNQIGLNHDDADDCMGHCREDERQVRSCFREAKGHTNPATPCQRASIRACQAGPVHWGCVFVHGVPKAKKPLTTRRGRRNSKTSCLLLCCISYRTSHALYAPPRTPPRTQAPRTPSSSTP